MPTRCVPEAGEPCLTGASTPGSACALPLAFTLLGVLNALLARVALGQWHFYPQMPRLMAWWGYLPFVLQVLLPSLAVLADRVSWRSR